MVVHNNVDLMVDNNTDFHIGHNNDYTLLVDVVVEEVMELVVVDYLVDCSSFKYNHFTIPKEIKQQNKKFRDGCNSVGMVKHCFC